MLFSYQYHRHTADKLQLYVLTYLRKIRYLPEGTAFDTSLFPDDLRILINRKYRGDHVKLYKYFSAFLEEFLKLKEEKRKLVINIFINSNAIQKQLRNAIPDEPLKLSSPQIPQSFCSATKNLFIHLYTDTLSKIGNISKHYEQFYKSLANTWCPFCGIEKLNSYRIYKQDYDHILYKSEYPTAAVNMKNLVPMGHECNRIHKGTKDILFDDIGTRRIFFYPFKDVPKLTIILDGSVLPSHSNMNGNWSIQFSITSPEMTTWDKVFNLSKRYKENILEAEFDGWIDQFVRHERINIDQLENINEETIKARFQKYSSGFKEDDYSDMNFIKSAALNYTSNNAPSSFFKALVIRISSPY